MSYTIDSIVKHMKGILNLIKWLFFWISLLFISLVFGSFLDKSIILISFYIVLSFGYYYFVFRNPEERSKRAYAKLMDVLMKDEVIIEKGIDKRPFALFSRRQVFAVTNSRIISIKRRLLGGFNMIDFQWKDLKDAQVSENVLPSLCGSSLTFNANFNEIDEVIEVFPELEIASNAYKYAQQQEQSWEEKRRIRLMEEKRAKAGGIMIGQNTIPLDSKGDISQNQQNQDLKIDIADELLKLKKLLDQGILSDAEFQEMKSKILARSTQNF